MKKTSGRADGAEPDFPEISADLLARMQASKRGRPQSGDDPKPPSDPSADRAIERKRD